MADLAHWKLLVVNILINKKALLKILQINNSHIEAKPAVVAAASMIAHSILCLYLLNVISFALLTVNMKCHKKNVLHNSHF